MTKSDQNKLMAQHKEFETHDKGVDEGKRMATNGIMVMAYHLKFIKEGKLYKAQGDDGQMSWNSYCASKQINVNTANKYITLYTFYIEEMGKPIEEISGISSDTLQKYQSALARITDPDKREEMYEVLKSPLSNSDKRKEFEEEKLIKERWLEVVKHDCGKYKIYYNQDHICSCQGTSAIFAKPIEQK